jgi:hypothetical protein
MSAAATPAVAPQPRPSITRSASGLVVVRPDHAENSGHSLWWSIVRRMGCTMLVLSIVGLAIMSLTYWQLYESNASLRDEWLAVKKHTSGTESPATLGRNVASALAQLGASVNARLLATLHPTLNAADAVSAALANRFDDIAVSAARAGGAPAATLQTLLTNTSTFDVARAIGARMRKVSLQVTDYRWCVATSRTPSGAIIAMCVTQAKNEQDLRIAVALFATSSSSSLAASDAIRLPLSGASVSLGSIAASLLAALGAVASQTASIATVGTTTTSTSGDTVVVDVTTAGTQSASGNVVVASSFPAGRFLDLLPRVAGSTFILSCPDGAADCGSFILMVDRQSSVVALATKTDVDAGVVKVYADYSDIPAKFAAARLVARDTKLTNATYSISTLPSGSLTAGTFYALRSVVTSAPHVSVIISFDGRETTVPAHNYAAAAIRVVDNSMLASHIVLAIGCILVVAATVFSFTRASSLAHRIADPIARLSDDFRYAAQMKLHHVTAYRVAEQAPSAPASPPSAVTTQLPPLSASGPQHLGSPTLTPMTGSASPIGSPGGGADLGRTLGGSRITVPPPVVAFSEFAAIALLQQRCNAMAVALDRCSRFLPRSIFRTGQSAAGRHPASAGAASGGRATASTVGDQMAPPDVADVFPRASRPSTSRRGSKSYRAGATRCRRAMRRIPLPTPAAWKRSASALTMPTGRRHARRRRMMWTSPRRPSATSTSGYAVPRPASST